MRNIFFLLFLFFWRSCFASDYCLVLLTDSRQLDYSHNRAFFKSIAKHPSDWSKNGDVGHAWVYLQGNLNGQCVGIEGGHSGELGHLQPKYFDGVMNAIESCEKDPIKYLWCTQYDGFFQSGSGKHTPTFAAKVEISPEQFHRIMLFMQHYPYHDYAITGNQCTTYVAQIAILAGLSLKCDVTMSIEQRMCIGGEQLFLWNNPEYSTITFSTPDVLEKSLRECVSEGKATCVLSWYLKTHSKPLCCRLTGFRKSVQAFPGRFLRYISL